MAITKFSIKFSFYFLLTSQLLVIFSKSPTLAQDIDLNLLEKMLLETTSNLHLPSLSIILTSPTETFYKKSFGPKSFNLDKIHNIGSCTKSFTALSILKLSEQGFLSLNSTLASLNLKEVASLFKSKEDLNHITINELLNHTSGLIEGEVEIEKGQGAIIPGQQGTFVYSNYGYRILGEIVKTLSKKKTYDEYLQENIFGPLNMSSSMANYDKAFNTGNLAKGHRNIFGFYYESDAVKRMMEKEEGFKITSGYILSSLDDMAKYIRFYLNSSTDDKESIIISNELKKKMFSKTVKTDEEGSEFYGMGWFTTVVNGETVHYHTGATITFNCIMFFIPNKKVGGMILIPCYDEPTSSKISILKKTNVFNVLTGSKNYSKLSFSHVLIHLSLDIFYLLGIGFGLTSLISKVYRIYKSSNEKNNSNDNDYANIGLFHFVLNFFIYLVLPIFLIFWPEMLYDQPWSVANLYFQDSFCVLVIVILLLATCIVKIGHFLYYYFVKNKTNKGSKEIKEIDELNERISTNSNNQ